MVKFKGVELTPEQVRKAMECDTPEELVAACKEIDIDITKEEAEKALENMAEVDLTPEQMKRIAGGISSEEMDRIGNESIDALKEMFSC